MSERGRSRWRWQPDWRLWVFAAVLFPLLLGLGIWQVQRAGEKEAMLAQWDQQLKEGDWREVLDSGLTTGQPVQVNGHYDPRAVWLLDNRTRDGRSGYEVLTLFHPLAGPPVLVNRGWLPGPRRRSQLPAVDTPPGRLLIRARVADYPTPPVLADTPAESGWPRRVQALQPDAVREWAPQAIEQVLRLENPAQPGAFRADWAPDLMGSQTHYGYALQWFSLAAALAILTIVASFRRGKAQDEHGNG
ncbi:SURF1 family protein [Marinobacter fonticola]|uniref:SURF1 family protein n=1 Tax=Marinobacter fonticola TaxID=2603215 RepID=UPI0011E777E6|nr:SURF1 family protein [Marinobacter fonticola]